MAAALGAEMAERGACGAATTDEAGAALRSWTNADSADAAGNAADSRIVTAERTARKEFFFMSAF
mgnify:CR=1 FL=1